MILTSLLFSLAYAGLSLYMMKSGNLFSSGLDFGLAMAFILVAVHQAMLLNLRNAFLDTLDETISILREIKEEGEKAMAEEKLSTQTA